MAITYPELDVDSDFGGRFPYTSKRLDVGGGIHMAFVDEGPRDAPLTFLMLHGNPTWGFLYRRFIDRLWNRYRVVVPDHVGFGRSDKPQSPDYYSLERHIRNLEALAKHLDLRNVVLVLHDWGGPIGMGWATRHPPRVDGFVVLNTWAFVERPEMRLPWLFRFLLQGSRGQRRIVRRNFFTEFILGRAGTARPLDPAILDAYRAPHPTPDDRTGVARFPALIPETHDVSHETHTTMKNIEHGLGQFQKHPALIAWAQRDAAFRRPFLERWQEVFPDHAGPLLLPHAKHYLQEDEPAQILQAIEKFAESIRPKQQAPPQPVAPKRTDAVAPPVEQKARPAPKTASPAPSTPPVVPRRPKAAPKPAPIHRPEPKPVSVKRIPTAAMPIDLVLARRDAVGAETFDGTEAEPPRSRPAASHLVEHRHAQHVQRVSKGDPRRQDEPKPGVAKPRVLRRQHDAVAVESAERAR
jgi:pimeloyl-ACP methyl ester carboxylesterase